VRISAKNLSFSYNSRPLFNDLNLDFEGSERPIVILGPSGSGKTTLLKLLGGLLKPQEGEIDYLPNTAFMFQEPRLLPWLSVLENVSLPLVKVFGQEEARARARHCLSLVSLQEKENDYPNELSGGQAHRVSMARAFAWPAPALFMDEPFQSLDIPLRIHLMKDCLSLFEKDKRLLIAVTHDPREAIYMGGRIIILGKAGEGIIFDREICLSPEDRAWGSAKAAELESEMIAALNSA
jgi:NitT/TauT family transport system ATP-binding protein